MVGLLLTFLISLLSFFALNLLGFSDILAFIFVGILILAISMYPLLRIAFFETDIEKIERFLLKNKKKPSFYIIYALANKLDDQVDQTTEKLLQTTKNKARQAAYKVVHALYFEDIFTAKREVKNIASAQYKSYYQAIIALEESDMEAADRLIEEVSSQWMKYALLAEFEKKKNNIEEAKNYASKALNETKGLQYYSLYKTYEREFQLNDVR